MTEKMQKLYEDRAKVMSTLDTLDAKENATEFRAKLDEIKAIDTAIAAQKEAEDMAKDDFVANANKPATDTKKFKSLGEQLRAIKNAAVARSRGLSDVDPRLISDDIKGVNTQTEADGGYAIQPEFIGSILDRAFERSEIINRCRQYSVAADSNRINYVTVDDATDAENETGVVVAGGVQVYWTDEGKTVTPSKPKFKSTELKLGKLMGIAYATEESLQDISFMAQFLEDSFSDAVAGALTDGVLNGTGADLETRQPLGVLKSQALVTVTPADTTAEGKKLKAQDFLNMKASLRKKDWANAVWYLHSDYEADLPLLADDHGNTVYLPEGGISGAQYATILGRPVVFDDFLPAKGEKGSILLANFDEYMIIKKGEERKDWSMHVEFLTDQQTFRIILRANGAPIRNNVWSVRHSKAKRGSFVALDKLNVGE